MNLNIAQSKPVKGFFVLLALCVSNAAIADVLIDNMDRGVRGITLLDNSLSAAQGFSTDAQPYQLNSITIEAGSAMGGLELLSELRRSTITGEIDTSPEGLVADLSQPFLDGALAERTFTPFVPVNLEASTKYFLVFRVYNGSFEWSYAVDNVWTGPGSFENYLYSSDQGETWADFGFDFPYKMRVDVTPGSNQLINPFYYLVTAGSEFAGGLESLFLSDDDCLALFNDETSLVAQVQFYGLTSILNPSMLTFALEASVSRPGLAQTTFMFNFDTESFMVTDGRVATFNDVSVDNVLTDTAPAAVGSGGELASMVEWYPINDEDPAQDGWLHCVDQAVWVAVP
ncbi:MAG TPA: choice-of-anchor R domain-containing protein [Fimbriimonadaceae bacterium]|nr:choice-of-anchor R domain-containing protein [Fimbriimonadaceae bacterium]